MNKTVNNNIEALKEILNSSENIAITTHRNPDGDALGSSIGLYNYLLEQGKLVNVIVPNSYPKDLHFLPGDSEVSIFCNNKTRCENIIKSSDLLIVLDYNDFSRTEDMADSLNNFEGNIIVIDHHPDPKIDATVTISDISVSSTCELVYEICSALSNNPVLSKNTATALYLGIMTDTGNFRHNCSNPQTFETVANLLRSGINKDEITAQIFESYKKDRLSLMGFCINDGLSIIEECNTAYITITKETRERFNYVKGDSEGFVNIPLSIEGIYFSAIFIEFEDHIKISFRSRGQFATNNFSSKYFNGGGHKNAAGGRSALSLTETIDSFIEKVNIHKNEIIY